MMRKLLAVFGLCLKKDLDEADAAIVLWRGTVYMLNATIEILRQQIPYTTDNTPTP